MTEEESSDIPNFHGHPSKSYWSFHSKPHVCMKFHGNPVISDGRMEVVDRQTVFAILLTAVLLACLKIKVQSTKQSKWEIQTTVKSDLVCFPFCLLYFDSIDSRVATIRLLFIEYQCLEPPPPAAPSGCEVSWMNPQCLLEITSESPKFLHSCSTFLLRRTMRMQRWSLPSHPPSILSLGATSGSDWQRWRFCCLIQLSGVYW